MSHRASSCPSWDRTRTLLIPYHFGFRRRYRSVRGLDCAFTFALRDQVAPAQSLHLPLSGLGSALPVKGPPTSRALTHTVSGVVSGAARVRRVASYTKGQCCRPTRLNFMLA